VPTFVGVDISSDDGGIKPPSAIVRAMMSLIFYGILLSPANIKLTFSTAYDKNVTLARLKELE
jgi:hypothetical protein